MKAGNPNKRPETEQEPSLLATYPIGLSSTIDPARPAPSFYHACLRLNGSLFCQFVPLYLGMRPAAAATTAAAIQFGRELEPRP